MKCPDCDHENIQGSEICEECGQDLAGQDLPTPTTQIQKKIMEDPLKNLHPAAPLRVPANTTVADAIKMMKDKRYGCIFIMEGDKLAGIFTERDVLLKLIGRNIDINNTSVRDVMTANPETLTEQDSVAYALNKMDVGGYRHIPIMHGEEAIGLVSVRGLLKYISDNLL